MSGYAANVLAPSLAEGVHSLQKPFSIPALAVKVRETLDSSQTDLTPPAARR